MDHTIEFDEFRAMIADHFGIETFRLAKDTSFFDDLGIDSLSLVNFVIKLEKRFGITIAMDNVWNLKNVGEAYGILMTKIDTRLETEKVT